MSKNRGILYYVSNYKLNSMVLRYFAFALIITIIPLLCTGGIFYWRIQKNMIGEIFRENNQVLNSASDVSDSIIKEITSLAAYFVQTPSARRYIYAGSNEELLDENWLLRLREQLSTFSAMNEYIDSIYIYSELSDKVLTNDGEYPKIDFDDKEIFNMYNELKGSEKKLLLKTRKYLGSYPYYLSFILQVSQGHNLVPDGAVIVNVDVLSLGKIINSTGNKNTKDVYMVLNNEQIAYSRRREDITKTISEIPILQSFVQAKQTENEIFQFEKEKYIISVSDSSKNPISYITISSMSQYSKEVRWLAIYLILMIIICFISSVIIAAFLAIKAFRPVQSIMNAIENPQKVQNEKTLESSEIKEIVNLIMTTINSNKQLRNEISERMKLLDEANLLALQAQINPHFLYNTLATISLMSDDLLDDGNEISKMLLDLAELFRVALEDTCGVVTVREEIRYTKLYINILKIRYNDKFDVVYNIDESIMSNKIIKLSLQPIIENAVHHGIRNKSSKGIIKIVGKDELDNYYISVIDDGAGMDENKLSQIISKLDSDSVKNEKHIGFLNVNQRIKMTYGENYGLKIQSQLGIGTTVTIKIPKV